MKDNKVERIRQKLKLRCSNGSFYKRVLAYSAKPLATRKLRRS